MNGLKKLEKVGLAAIFDLIPGGVCIATDASCKEIIHNPVAAEFFRIQPWTSLSSSAGQEQVQVLSGGKVLSPEEMPIQRAAWFGAEVTGVELEFLWKDGVIKHALFSSHPLRDEQDNIIAAICTFEDITPKKRIEAELKLYRGQLEELVLVRTRELQERKAQFRECLDTLFDCFAIYEAVRDETGKITDFTFEYVNEAACRHYNKTAAELVGKKMIQVYPNMAGTVFPDFCREVETGKPYSNDNWEYRDDINPQLAGTYDVSQVKLGDGVAVCWRNITERKRLERELKLREEQYRIVVESQTELVCRSLPDTTVTFANEAFCKVFGGVKGKVTGKKLLEFIQPAKRPALQQLWNELCLESTGNAMKKMAFLLGSDGNPYWIEWVNHPIVDGAGNVVEIQSVGRDRTSERRLEEELRRNEKKHRVLLDSIPCLVLWLNKAGTIEFVNEFANRFFGDRMGKLSGLPILGTIIPDDGLNGQSLLQMAKDSFAGKGRPPLVSEYHLPNDSHFWLQWTFRKYAHPITGTQGILCVGFDITDRRQAEQALQRRYELRYWTIVFNKALRGVIGGQELVEITRRFGVLLGTKSLLHIIHIQGVIDGGQLLRAGQAKQYQAEIDRLIEEISHKTAGIAWQSPAGLAVLMPLTGEEDATSGKKGYDTAAIPLTLIQKAFPDKQVLVGIAAPTGNPPDLVLSYQQAKFALRAGRTLDQEKVVHYWQELGMLQLMSACCDSNLSKAFVQAELGELLAHDKQKASFLVDTLEAILTADSVAAIAKQLYVHEKTVLFRKRKIEGILGISIDHNETRLNLLTAIRLLRLMQLDSNKWEYK